MKMTALVMELVWKTLAVNLRIVTAPRVTFALTVLFRASTVKVAVTCVAAMRVFLVRAATLSAVITEPASKALAHAQQRIRRGQPCLSGTGVPCVRFIVVRASQSRAPATDHAIPFCTFALANQVSMALVASLPCAQM